jgi:hypothetical protein
MLSLLLAGCGGKSGPQYSGVRGDVSYQGEVVDEGTISFLPSSGEGDAVGIPIVNGHYEVPAERGLLPGEYRVEVRWQKATGKMVKDADLGTEVPERTEGLPAEFHEASTLTTKIEPGSNVFDVKQ